MTDFLLVHGAGQGAWAWGQVWGHLTAPVEHPPRLYTPRRANKVCPIDLPGHGADARGDTGDVTLDECVHAVARAVEREDLQDVTLVGHGMGGPLVLLAASQLASPPKRLVLVAGIVPNEGKSMASVLPPLVRRGFYPQVFWSKLTGREIKVPRSVMSRYLFNGMDPMKAVKYLRYFGPLPIRVLTAPVALEGWEPPCPVTYVVLTQDRLLPPEQQHRMAGRVPGAELVEVEANHQAMLHCPRGLAEVLLRFA